MVTILTKDNPLLRKVATEIAHNDFASEKLENIKQDLHAGLQQEKYGVAIAAPQIGHSVRMFLLDLKTIQAEQIFASITDNRYCYIINPKITQVSKKMRRSVEGCLSVPGKVGTVLRHQKITLDFFDEAGNKHTLQVQDFLASVMQHEYDHLDGILYIDKAEEVHAVDENMNPIE